jgi:hypothetical protein
MKKTSCDYLDNHGKCSAEDSELGCLCRRKPKAQARRIRRAWIAWRSHQRFQPHTHIRLIKVWQSWKGE